MGPTECVFIESNPAAHSNTTTKISGKWRCCEVEVQETQDIRIERTGTLARIQEKEIRGPVYIKLYQCSNTVPYQGGRCKSATRQALVDAIGRLETVYEEKFKKVFGWGKGVVGS